MSSAGSLLQSRDRTKRMKPSTRINRLTAQARAAGVPVIFIQHEQTTGILAYGSDGWQLAAGLAVMDADDKVRKTTPDSFLRTGLLEMLAQKSADNLVICGYASEFCVDTTTRRAAALGVCRPACGRWSYDP